MAAFIPTTMEAPRGDRGRKGHREFVRSNRRKSLELAVAELSQGLIQGTWE